MLFDFTLTRNVIGEEVAGDAHPDVGHLIALAEEAQEERDHPRVGVRELHRIARPRSFSPEKHAAGDVEEVAGSRVRPAFDLKPSPPSSSTRSVFRGTRYGRTP